MATRNMSLRIEEEMLNKIHAVAEYQGRSVNSHILVLIREEIERHEAKYGEIDGTIDPAKAVMQPRWTRLKSKDALKGDSPDDTSEDEPDTR